MNILEHTLPERDDIGVKLISVLALTAMHNSHGKAVRIADFSQIHPAINIAILVHLTDTVLTLVFSIHAHFCLDNWMDSHVSCHMGSVSK